MKHLVTVRTLVGVMSVALLMATVPAGAWAYGPGGIPQEESDYVQREAASCGLESFEGGWHGVLFFFVLVAAIVILVDALFCDTCDHHCPRCPHPIPSP